MLISTEKYFDTLDFIHQVNGSKFEDLDLSRFFGGDLSAQNLKAFAKRLPETNNFNKIYLLITQEYLRTEFKITLLEKLV